MNVNLSVSQSAWSVAQ